MTTAAAEVMQVAEAVAEAEVASGWPFCSSAAAWDAVYASSAAETPAAVGAVGAMAFGVVEVADGLLGPAVDSSDVSSVHSGPQSRSRRAEVVQPQATPVLMM